MKSYVEHANITVQNLASTIEFLRTAVPDLPIRHQGFNDKPWCHIGDDHSYLALQEPTPGSDGISPRKPYDHIGINHIGLVVEDIDSVQQRLLEAGYQQNHDMHDEVFRKRCYFFDENHIEWEFIEYLSDNPQERHHYA